MPYALLYTPIFFGCSITITLLSTHLLRIYAHLCRLLAFQTSSRQPRLALPDPQELVLRRPSARWLLLSRPPSISQVGFPLLLPPGVTSSPLVTWTNRCATTLNLALSASLSCPISHFFLPDFFFLFPARALRIAQTQSTSFGIELTYSFAVIERRPPLLLHLAASALSHARRQALHPHDLCAVVGKSIDLSTSSRSDVSATVPFVLYI